MEKRLYLHTSNRMENLGRRLWEVTAGEPLSSPFRAESVLVQNSGVGRWLSFEIARRSGIAANWKFLFPAEAFRTLLEGIEPEYAERGLFEASVARWELFRLLQNLPATPGFDLPRAYCAKGGSLRRYQLASQLAWLFDQYLVYRPEEITAWERGSGRDDWQSHLWRELAKTLFGANRQPAHIARLWERISTGGGARVPNTDAWPERLCVFGISTLPPLYLDLLDFVARHIPVHLFLLQPSDLYWSDLRSGKTTSKDADALFGSGQILADESAFDENANPLLPSWSKQSQAFLDLLIDKNPQQDDATFQIPDTRSQLGALQDDFMTLRNRSAANADPDAEPFPPADGSIQFHNCHSPRREVEALRDGLLDAFETFPGLLPEEILVMAPDIQDYAPHLESVLNAVPEGQPRIPFSIADRSSQNESRVASAAVALLTLPIKRLTSLELLEWLERPAVSGSLGFSPEDLRRIEVWIRDIGPTWGWNEKRRETFGAFPAKARTWREFRQRLGAGLALQGEGILRHDALAYDQLDGDSIALAGKLLETLSLLDNWIEAYDQTRPLAQWAPRITDLLHAFFGSDDSSDLAALDQVIAQELPPLETVDASGREVVHALEEAINKQSLRSGYFNGLVTCCSLKPMRSIPARVIWLLGMNNEDFPRKNTRVSFDLLAQEQRPGDRNAREEDKQLFLETILSARDRLCISYRGKSAANDDQVPPSPVVSELMEYMAPAQVFEHRRQNYDPAYFSGDSLFTYAASRFEACRSLFASATRSSEPAPATIAAAPASATIELKDLESFFARPQKTFLQETLGIAFPREQDPLLDIDPIELSPLDRYKLRDRLLPALTDSDGLGAKTVLSQNNLLPPGWLATLKYDESEELVAALRANLATELPLEKLEWKRVSHQAEATRVEGGLLVDGDRQLILISGRWKATNLIAAWIRHLLLASRNSRAQTLAVSLDAPGSWIRFGFVENAPMLLEDLIRLRQEGLSQPSLFFPEASKRFAESLAKTNPSELEIVTQDALNRAAYDLRKSQDFGDRPGSADWDEACQICFGDSIALGEEFANQTLAVFGPLLANLEKEKQ